MSILSHDAELGDIELRRYKRSTSLKLSVKPDGSVTVSAPQYMPLFMIKRFITRTRNDIINAKQSAKQTTAHHYTDQELIGKSHRIVLNQLNDELSAYTVGQLIRWSVPVGMSPDSTQAQDILRPVIDKVLRKQAKSYLPRQLAHLASQHGFKYERLRFGNAKGRWGSCSSSGTISLNIALMRLPNELIDYVLLHELCHTKQMNHSQAFWSLVKECSPNYKLHRHELKKHSPYI